MTKAKDKAAPKPPADKSSKLSALGVLAETLLKSQLDDMDADLKLEVKARQYSLTDRMKVLDRIIRLEAIKAKSDDDEGGFFDE